MTKDTSTLPCSVISQDDFLSFFNLDGKAVESFAVYHSKDGIQVDITLEKRLHQCPVCLNMTDKIKDYSIKKITHSVLSFAKCTINYKARRYRCPNVIKHSLNLTLLLFPVHLSL